jgi:NAD-dependent deacetylase
MQLEKTAMRARAKISSIVVLTGAGVSAASGLSTFRDKTGIWAKYDYREVATPQGFARNPSKVHEFYNLRRRDAAACLPNPAHIALAALEAQWRGKFLLVTQNVDGLHEAAGSTKLLHMHGQLSMVLCTECGAQHQWKEDLTVSTICPACSRIGRLRPDIVWFGEMPYHVDKIENALQRADLFVSIGTSGTVYPAAGFALQAKMAGVQTIELNLERSSPDSDIFDDCVEGPAEQTLPIFVERLLAAQG